MRLTHSNPLGKSGINVPKIIYGTSYLGNLYKDIPLTIKKKLVEKWFECTDLPVVIDTAGKYGAGLALEVIGKCLKDMAVAHKEIIISNKLGWYRVPLVTKEPTFEPGAWAGITNDAIQCFGYDEIIRCYHQGIELLDNQYNTDLVSLHDPDEYLFAANDKADRSKRMKELLDSYKALFDLKASGKVRSVGIGAKNWKVIRELYEYVKFDWIMLANSFTIYSHPKELLEFIDGLSRDGVGIINSAIFHGGFLTGHDKFDYQTVDPESAKGKALFAWREKFFNLCGAHSVEPAKACLHFATSHPAIAAVALNTSVPEKMNHNVELLTGQLPDAFWNDLVKHGVIDRVLHSEIV